MVVHRKQEGCTQETGGLYTVERRFVRRKQEGCTQEKGGLYTGERSVVHRRKEGCTHYTGSRRVLHDVIMIDMPLFPYVPFLWFDAPLS
jgi:hypothetical protein